MEDRRQEKEVYTRKRTGRGTKVRHEIPLVESQDVGVPVLKRVSVSTQRVITLAVNELNTGVRESLAPHSGCLPLEWTPGKQRPHVRGSFF